jgi:hypothetical protein
MRVVPSVTLIGLLALLSPIVRGQDRDPVVADALLREGRRAADAGDLRAACPKIAESYRLDPIPGTVFDLADCEERQGRLAAAWIDYRKAVDALSPSDARLAIAKDKVASLEKRLARLTVRLGAGAVPGTVVKRDGVEIGKSALGVAIPADPGKHVVVVSQGARERRYEVVVGEGESKELVADLPPAAIAPDEPGLLERPPAMTSVSPEAQAHQAFSGDRGSASEARIFGYVVGGIGAASLAVGVVTKALSLGKKSTIDSHCTAVRVCDHVGMDAVTSAQDLQTASTVTLAVGIGGLATGALLILLNPSKPAQPALHPTILPGGAGLAVSRSF